MHELRTRIQRLGGDTQHAFTRIPDKPTRLGWLKMWKRLTALAGRTALRILRRIPALRAADDRRYDRIESMLNNPAGEVDIRPSLRFLLCPDVVHDSLVQRCDYRVIDPVMCSDEDLRFLDEQGLNPEYIVRNRLEPYPPVHGNPDVSAHNADALDFQLQAILDGAVAAICPYTGEVIYSNRSMVAAEGAPIFYRYLSQGQLFDLAVGIPGIGYQKLYFYFPTLNAVVLIRSRAFWHGRENIDRLRARSICEWMALRAYQASTAQPMVTILVDNSHFAHHMWNDLTGLDRLLTTLHSPHIPAIVACAEPFAALEAIFPALRATHIHRERFPAILTSSLRQNRLLLRIGDNRISDRVIRGLLQAAEGICSEDIRQRVRQMRERHWPILWMTIRTGNRTWVSQCTGIPHIVNELLREYPHMALIIDGFCLPQDHPAMAPREQVRIIEHELACVQQILSRLPPSLPVRVNVGRSLAESVLFAAITDCYLAHHGSLQHKIGWIANCPGVVHSNCTDLINRGGRYRAMFARENAVEPILLDPDMVIDVSGATLKASDKWNDPVANYDFDPRSARDLLLEVLKHLPKPLHYELEPLETTVRQPSA